MSANEPRVTTIIPSYNHAKYVAQAIESVLTQDYSNHELIVVDDGSRDGSAEIIASYRGHPLVTVILNDENRGQSAALSQGLKMARGQFIALLPSDDWLLPSRNRVQIQQFEKASSDVGIIYGRGRRFIEQSGEFEDVELPLLRGDLFEHLLSQMTIFPVTPLIRAECYAEFPPDPSVSAEGEALWIKMASKWRFDFVDSVVGVMRQHDYNSGRNWQLTYRQNVDYWERWFNDPDMPSHVREYRSRALAYLHRRYGLTFLRDADDAETARQALFASIRQRPSQLLTDWKLWAGTAMACLGFSRLHPVEGMRPAKTRH